MEKQKTVIVPADEWTERAEEAASAVRGNRIVLFPTETVYGIGTAATEEGAAELADFKRRDSRKPFQILIADEKELEKYGARLGDTAKRLIDTFWPGPMTLILEVDSNALPGPLAPSGSAGFRIPDHGLCRDLIRRAGGAIAATSANMSGGKEARTCREAIRAFRGRLAVAVDAGPIAGSVPSTVVSIKNDVVAVIRETAISESEIIEAAGD